MLHNSRTVAVVADEPLTIMMVPRSPQFPILPGAQSEQHKHKSVQGTCNIGRGSNPIGVTMPTSPLTHLLEAHTNLAAALIAAR